MSSAWGPTSCFFLLRRRPASSSTRRSNWPGATARSTPRPLSMACSTASALAPRPLPLDPMPAQQPFTALCRLVAQARPHADRADLHLHTTHSDGSYTPAQVVELAVRSGLCAIAITDHDTLSGVAPARAAAVRTGLEVIAGVEISTEHHGRELHLLGYFVHPEDVLLAEALQRLRD